MTDKEIELTMGGLVVLSTLGGIGIGFVAATKFVWWVACLWGFGSYIALFIVGLAAWGMADSLQWIEKHRREEEEHNRSLGGAE